MARKAGKADPRSANSVDAHIGARIRARRKEIGMSQQALAGALGVTFQQVQKYENGVNRISARVLWSAAQVLDTTYAALLPKLPVGRDMSETVLDTVEFAKLGAYFARLNAAGRSALMSTARALADNPDLIDKRAKK